MPGGKTHYRIWVRSWPTAAFMAFLHIEFSPWLGLGYVIGYVVGSVITPDSDQIGIDRGEALAIKSILFLSLVAWSTMYARFMQVVGGHRGLWLHFPWISTFVRLAWFGMLVVVPVWMIGYQRYYLTYNQAVVAVGIWLGKPYADLNHYVADNARRLFKRDRYI